MLLPVLSREQGVTVRTLTSTLNILLDFLFECIKLYHYFQDTNCKDFFFQRKGFGPYCVLCADFFLNVIRDFGVTVPRMYLGCIARCIIFMHQILIIIFNTKYYTDLFSFKERALDRSAFYLCAEKSLFTCSFHAQSSFDVQDLLCSV